MDHVKSRTSLHHRLNKILLLALDHKKRPLTLAECRVLETSSNETFEKAETAHFSILATCTEQKAVDTQEDEMDKVTETYHKVLKELTVLKDLLSSTSSSSSSSSSSGGGSSTAATAVKLPKIDLPTFEGSFSTWPEFRDRFTANIRSNNSLSKTQKLEYLKSCVKGEAKKLIAALPITDSNYTEAWSRLELRFDNERELLYSLLDKLFDQKKVQNDSVSAIQQLLDTTTDIISQLRVMGRPVDHWDDILCAIIVRRLDGNSRAEWARSLTATQPPTFKELQTFLEKHIRFLLARGVIAESCHPRKEFKKQTVNTHHATAEQSKCGVCQQQHPLFRCNQFKGLSPEERFQAVIRAGKCTVCLTENHDWKSCTFGNCRRCGLKHNSLLHGKFASPAGSSGSRREAGIPAKTVAADGGVMSNFAQPRVSQVLLKTAMGFVTDEHGINHPCRILIDDGSEATFMREDFAAAVGLKRTKVDVQLSGIAAVAAGRSNWRISTTVGSRVRDASIAIEALLLPQVTAPLRKVDWMFQQHPQLIVQDIELSDPHNGQPREIDVLLGLDIISDVLLEGLRKGPIDSCLLQNTIFGWVLFGKVGPKMNTKISAHLACCKLVESIQKFWEVEKVPVSKPLTQEEMKCEEHFSSSHTRKMDGRFVVRLPFNNKITKLGESRELAKRRLLQLERRFTKHPTHHTEYKKFMKEYLDLGHMELAPTVFPPMAPVIKYFIPHHFVLKEDSTTTKLRVVFDASMKTTTGISLNDAMLIGPTVQDDLLSLLMRFRLPQVAVKADVAKMYRQFEVHPDDRDQQMILWRNSPEEEIQEYHLKTVTYGTACAPFLATRCLNQLSNDEEAKFPAAAKAVRRSMYVDDLLGGTETDEEAIQLYNEMKQMCAAGGMEIRKWCSNSQTLLDNIPTNEQETSVSLDFEDGSNLKALGLRWNPTEDEFHFKVKHINSTAETKRKILSEMASTFDPVGWISPITITAKILMQDLWRAKADWDEKLPEVLIARWKEYCASLEDVKLIKIPRVVLLPNPISTEIHCFSDASEKAYAACIYIRSTYGDGIVIARLFTARTRVAPLRQLSIPRLELCGAHILSELYPIVSSEFAPDTTCFAWTDSMVVLQWITRPSRNWKTYVANRVSAVQETLPPAVWRHVHGEENPADLPSRGLSPAQLAESDLWWHGPAWLSERELLIPNFIPADVDEEVAKEDKADEIFTNLSKVEEMPILSKLCNISSFNKMIIAMAWLKRFLSFRCSKLSPPAQHKVAERNQALHTIIRLMQAAEYPEEIDNLKKRKRVLKRSSIIKLNPFLGPDGIMRVGGRLRNSALSHEQKHPIILPGSNHITEAMIREFHFAHLHGGYTLTKSLIQRRYHIVGGRNPVRKVVKSCVKCRKVKAAPLQQQMGNLPMSRVTPSRPFLHSGVDFCGPFNIKTRSGRGAKVEKFYVAVFVCFATKACHLEPVSNLSTGGFLATYKRFTSRRGACSHLYSDCGTNFVGANREFLRLLSQQQDEFINQLKEHAPVWEFHPPSAPHRNGLSEAAVKSAKFHMKRVVGEELLTYEQFLTLLCSIEACLNSRPLCPLTSDPDSFDVLTPGHFLIGEPIAAIPERDQRQENTGRLDDWRRVQKFTQTLWTRWKDEYLNTLQHRPKWEQPRPNLQKDDLVIIKDDNLAPTKWRIGRIITTSIAPDGLVRKATLKTATGVIDRPIQKLSILLRYGLHCCSVNLHHREEVCSVC